MNRDFQIPFSRPTQSGRELDDLETAVTTGHLSGDGPFARKCSELLEAELGVARVLLTSSCTHALEMCALLLDIQPGDEVIVPSFAYVSTANAFAMRGARPVFVDIRRDTLNLDEELVARKITKKTRAIVALHYGGVGCEMDRLLDISLETGVPIIEDNAHGLFGRCRQGFLGTRGALGAISFHATKTFTCGEGGAILIDDPELIVRAEILREKGTNRTSFVRGEVERYTWVDYGSSYLPSELQAAYLHGQLLDHDRILEERRRLWRAYREALAEWAMKVGVTTSVEPEAGLSTCHIFFLLLPSRAARDGLIDHLAGQGIQAVFHYLPLHLSRMGRSFSSLSNRGGHSGGCPVAESVSDRIVRLPLYHRLEASDQERVIKAVLEFDPHNVGSSACTG